MRGVIANGERIEANDVVLATNAYTPHLLPDLPTGAIVPARGQILATQPVPAMIPHPFGTNFDKEYGRQTATGQLICGGYRRDRCLRHQGRQNGFDASAYTSARVRPMSRSM